MVNEQRVSMKGALQTTFAALSQVSNTMLQARAKLTRLADGSISTEQRNQYAEKYRQLTTQITDDAKYIGRTLLNTNTPSGGDNLVSIRNEEGGQFTVWLKTAPTRS